MLRPKLNRIWTGDNAVVRRDPGDAKYIQGWVSEIPTFQVLNYLQYKVDTTLLALAERGVFEWGSDVQYGLGSLVWDETNKTIYVSTVGAPSKTLKPSSNLTQWAASSIQVSRADYDTVVAAINAHIADVTGNPHQLTPARLGAYTKAEANAIADQYRQLVATHVADKNNPHGVTAAQAGAVPTTGGTYSGDVVFNAGLFLNAAKTSEIYKTGGVFLKAGNGILGIKDNGDAVAGTLTSQSKLILESGFAGFKQTNEADYATPTPAIIWDLIGNICPRLGAGTVDSGSLAVAYENGTGAITFSNAEQAQGMGGDTFMLADLTKCTIAVDIKSTVARNTDTATSFILGTGSIHIYSSGVGQVGVEFVGKDAAGTTTYAGASFRLSGNINTWYRIVGTWDGTTYKIFLNGVLQSTSTNKPIKTIGADKFSLSVAAKLSEARRTFQARNVRIWSEALTDKQISTL